jgi:starch-binding outer membrane protein, SusD/RagB family
MKRIYSLRIFTIGMLFFLTSCEDFLKEEPIDSITVDYIYTTAGGLEVGVNALYNLQRINNFPSQDNDTLKANAFFYVADDLGLTRTWHDPYGPNQNPAAFPATKWTLPYQIIDRASAIITSARSVDMDQDEKDHLVAQARAIRGELYLDLITMYDNIVLDTTPTTPENLFDSIVYEVADPVEVYKLIDADLDFAIAHLEWTEEFGRYNQATVRHIRGKSAMWQSDWTEAAAQFDAIINNGTYHLLTNITEVFGQDLNHAEALFVYPFDEQLGGTDQNTWAGGGGTWMSSFFNNRYYELSSGEMIRSAELGGQSLGWSYPNDYLKSLYDQVNDKRFETYYFPLTLIVNNPEKDNYGEPLPTASYEDNYRRYHWSLKKYLNTDKALGADDSYKSIIYYRFAETLLLGAEAHWRLSGSSNDATALDYINKIRRRAFGVDDASYDFTSFTLDTYLEESARELAFEKGRWFLLKRLGLLVQRQNLHYRFGSNSTNEVTRPMAEYMVRLPIPQSQIDLMGTFPQNPGY